MSHNRTQSFQASCLCFFHHPIFPHAIALCSSTCCVNYRLMHKLPLFAKQIAAISIRTIFKQPPTHQFYFLSLWSYVGIGINSLGRTVAGARPFPKQSLPLTYVSNMFWKVRNKASSNIFLLRQRGNCISVLSSREQPVCAFGSASGESSAGTENAPSYKGALKTVTRVHVHPCFCPDKH